MEGKITVAVAVCPACARQCALPRHAAVFHCEHCHATLDRCPCGHLNARWAEAGWSAAQGELLRWCQRCGEVYALRFANMVTTQLDRLPS